MLRIITILLCWLFASLTVSSVYAQRTGDAEKDAALADQQAAKRGNLLKVREDAPDRYVVLKGDTLWHISSKYLLDPWRWPELWRGNREQIKDPHWIFPGDVLILDRANASLRLGGGVGESRPSATNDSGGQASRDIRLSPQVRSELIGKAVNVLPAHIVEPFLSKPQVIEVGSANALSLENAPMIVGGKEGKTLLGSGDAAYIAGLASEQINWNAVRPGKVLKDPGTGEVLGTEAIYLGKAKVIRRGEPAEVMIGKVKLEILKGDRLLPDERVEISNFSLKSPAREIEARVASIYGSVDIGGNYSIITVNRGNQDGLENGDVLALYRSTLPVSYKPDGDGKTVTLQPVPDRYGLVVIFKVSDRISYALVMNADRELAVGDTLRNP